MTNVHLVQELLQHTEYRSSLIRKIGEAGQKIFKDSVEQYKKDQDHRSRQSTIKKLVDEIAEKFARRISKDDEKVLTVKDLNTYTQHMKYLQNNKNKFFSKNNDRFALLKDKVEHLGSVLINIDRIVGQINTESCDDFENLKNLHEAYDKITQVQEALNGISKKEIRDMTGTLKILFEIREKGTKPTDEMSTEKIDVGTREKIIQIIESAKKEYSLPSETYAFIHNSLNFGQEYQAKPEHIDKVKEYLETTDIITFLTKIYDIPNYCSAST